MRSHSVLALLCAAALAAAQQGDAPLLGAAAPSAAVGDDEVVRSDLGCGLANNSKWTRRLCFGDAALDGPAPEGLTWAVVNLSVAVRDASARADEPFRPACGDALRVRFASRRALFAPRQHEPECGVHTLRFIVPPDSVAYSADVWVVHVDGQGMGDPPTPRLFPINLMSMQDGPLLFNIRAQGFTRAGLRVAAGYVRAAPDARGDAYDLRAAANARRRGVANLQEEEEEQLPVCDSGEAPGRWVVTHSLYSHTLGEPLTWQPYGCRWRHVSGAALDACVSALGSIKFVGESTLGQVYEYWQAHIAKRAHAWPQRIDVDNSIVVYQHPLLYGQRRHSEFHGLPTMLENEEGGALAEIISLRPKVIVHLQTANDAARDTFAKFKQRLANYTAQLTALRARDADMGKAQLVWITAPVRHYKAGNGPGSASCPEGTKESCRAADSGTAYTHIGGEVAWVSHAAAPPLFYGTLDRRRAFNAHAVAHMRAAFPGAVDVIDFEALTESLPSDYNMDGEHWGCNWEKWQNRHREPFQCRSLAHVVLCNVLANVVCGARLDANATQQGAAV